MLIKLIILEEILKGGIRIKKKLLILIIFSITVLLFTSYGFAENNTENSKQITKKENTIQKNTKLNNENKNVKTAENNNDTKQKTNIQVTSNKTFHIGKSENIIVKVLDDENKSVTKGKVVIKVNNNSIGSGHLQNGTFTTEYNYTGCRNSFNLSVIYGDNNKYFESRYNEIINVEKIHPKLEIVNSSMVIDPSYGLIVHIKGSNPDGSPLTGRMFMKINGKTFISHENVPFYRGFENGTVTFEVLHSLIPYAAREYYNITFIYDEITVYARTNISAMFKYERARLNITLDKISVLENNTISVSGKIKTKVGLQNLNKFQVSKVCLKIDDKTLRDSNNKPIYTNLNLEYDAVNEDNEIIWVIEDFYFTLDMPIPSLRKNTHNLMLCVSDTSFIHGTRVSAPFVVS